MANCNIEKVLDVMRDCVGSKRLKINPQKSFVEIFKFSAHIFQNEKVFLSEVIFQELCKECEKKNGTIQLNNYSDNNFVYQLRFSDINNKKQQSEINILLKIRGSKHTKNSIQLLSFSSTEAKYTAHNAPKLTCGFFIDRPKTLKNEVEICQ